MWTMPDNFSDLYRLPISVLNAIKHYVTGTFPVRLNGPSQIALFAYDNNTFILESYLPAESSVTVSVAGQFAKLRNLVTGETVNVSSATSGDSPKGPTDEESNAWFSMQLPAHSYRVFRAEN